MNLKPALAILLANEAIEVIAETRNVFHADDAIVTSAARAKSRPLSRTDKKKTTTEGRGKKITKTPKGKKTRESSSKMKKTKDGSSKASERTKQTKGDSSMKSKAKKSKDAGEETSPPDDAPKKFQPSAQPSVQPSAQPSVLPSDFPTQSPSDRPSSKPSAHPSEKPSGSPSSEPSSVPTKQPSEAPSHTPSVLPSHFPTETPSKQPSKAPSESSKPSSTPSVSSKPTSSYEPSHSPTLTLKPSHSSNPSSSPTKTPINFKLFLTTNDYPADNDNEIRKEGGLSSSSTKGIQIQNSQGILVRFGAGYEANTSYEQEYTLPGNDCYTFHFYDNYEDGIHRFGNGSFRVEVDGNEILRDWTINFFLLSTAFGNCGPDLSPMAMEEEKDGSDDVVNYDPYRLELFFQTDLYPSDNDWEIEDQFGVVNLAKSDYDPDTLYEEDYMLPRGGLCYTFRFYDNYEDGVCCEWGNGSFRLELDGVEVLNDDGEDFFVLETSFGDCD